MPSDEKSSLIKDNKTLIGALNPYLNKEKLINLVKKKVNIFSLELLQELLELNLWIYYPPKQILLDIKQ